MSMFYRPGEDSSSSSEASLEQTQDGDLSESQQERILTRINTLNSTSSGQTQELQSRPQTRHSSSQDVRDLLLHSLLEDKAIAQAAEKLGKDRSDPEVQRLGRDTYQEVARQISSNVDSAYASSDMQSHRATAQEGITRLTRSNLNRLAVIPEGALQALVALPANRMTVDLPQQPPVDLSILSGISAPAELQLPGYPNLQRDRYAREFAEVEVIGKGGFGKVFKARHHLDGTLYAVKRIPVSPAKLARVQEYGPQELESMLEEVRSLARFEHANIVRYHNAWLEFTTVPAEGSALSPSTLVRPRQLLQDAPASSDPVVFENFQTKFEDLSFGDPIADLDDDHNADIVFETSEPGSQGETSRSDADFIAFRNLKPSKGALRRGSHASQATIATLSSTKSRMSAVEDVDEEQEDDDIETIPRSHIPHSQEPTSVTSENMLSHSDVNGPVVPVFNDGPILSLNVQMSLCETTLASFLSSEPSTSTPHSSRHCFHPCISLELLTHIVSGVAYLHAQNVVHRDLKPANIFLSVSTARHAPYGSVNLSSCKPCPERECLHIQPRIGDFGLVAALGDQCVSGDAGTAKPVGTEFYRPETNAGISENLDIFALGIVGFEMLQNFGTKMERVDALTRMRRGQFPDNFSQRLGDVGDRVQGLLADMVQVGGQAKMDCEQVKHEISRIVHILKEF